MKDCAILSWLIVIHLLKELGQTRFQLVLVHDQRLHHHLLIPLCPFNGWLAKPRVVVNPLLHTILIFTQNAKQYLMYINWSESIRTRSILRRAFPAALPSLRWEPQHSGIAGLHLMSHKPNESIENPRGCEEAEGNVAGKDVNPNPTLVMKVLCIAESQSQLTYSLFKVWKDFRPNSEHPAFHQHMPVLEVLR